jgi:hypothetical protein
VLSLGKTGGIGVYAGCNLGSADARLSRGRLYVTRMTGTQMGCDDDAEIRLVDRQTVTPDRPLTGTRWTIHTWLATTPTEAYLVFDGTGGFTGSTGCTPVSVPRCLLGGSSLGRAEILITGTADSTFVVSFGVSDDLYGEQGVTVRSGA